MQDKVKQKLVSEYLKLNFRQKSTCLKFSQEYKGKLQVILYFDAFDRDNLSLVMILKYGNIFYYTSLNINDTDIKVEYLKSLPSEMLTIILDTKKSLQEFFAFIEELLLSDSNVTSYQRDTYFVNTIKWQKKVCKDLPFLSGFSRKNMSQNMYDILIHTMGIPVKIVDAIREAGFTLVRTDDISKRKNIRAVIKEIGIKVDF